MVSALAQQSYYYHVPNLLTYSRSTHAHECTQLSEQGAYISQLLQYNNIEEEKFKENISMIMEKRHNKINTLGKILL